MSESWQQTVADAFGRADELGLEIALAAGAGWCGAGGPWVKPEESMQFLVTSETRVHGPGKFSGQLPRPKPRTPFFGEETLTPELRATWENFYIDSCALAFPAPQGQAQTADLAEKALYMRGSYSSQILGPYSTVPWVRPFLPSRCWVRRGGRAGMRAANARAGPHQPDGKRRAPGVGHSRGRLDSGACGQENHGADHAPCASPGTGI